MRVSWWLNFVLLALLVFSCGKPLPDIEGIDLARWKEDANGCKNNRAQMKSALQKEKQKLLALDEMQIIKLLGRPDRNEIFKRNQKFYYYFIQPSESCTAPAVRTEKLSIRFNAMGLAKEVIIE